MASGRRGLCFAPSSGSPSGSLAGAGDGRKEMLKHFQKMLVKTFKKMLDATFSPNKCWCNSFEKC
jgi:hypothetical protein